MLINKASLNKLTKATIKFCLCTMDFVASYVSSNEHNEKFSLIPTNKAQHFNPAKNSIVKLLNDSQDNFAYSIGLELKQHQVNN